MEQPFAESGPSQRAEPDCRREWTPSAYAALTVRAEESGAEVSLAVSALYADAPLDRPYPSKLSGSHPAAPGSVRCA